jgi:hypothetical protein
MATSVLNTTSLEFKSGATTHCQLSVSADTLTFNGASNAPVELKNLAAPTTDNSAVRKTDLDAVSQGVHWTESVRVLSDANVSISSAPTQIDGITMSNGDRVALFSQGTTTEDGVYVYNGAASAMTRALDWASGDAVSSHAFFVQEGTYDNSGWVVSNNTGSDVLGTDDITVVRFSGLSDVVAGDGLAKSGNTLSANVGQGLEISADNIQVQNLAITNAMLAGSIANAKLSNSAVDVVSGSGLSTTAQQIALGGSSTLSVNVDDSTIQVNGIDNLEVKDSGITNAKILDTTIANAKLVNSSLDVVGGDGIDTTSSTISLGGTATLSVDSTVVRTTTNQSIAGVKTFSDTTDATSTTAAGMICSGGVGIALDTRIGGDCYATAFNTTSDARRKKDIHDIKDATHVIMKVRPVSYKWIDAEKGLHKHHGVIAQEMLNCLPEAVRQDKSGYYSVEYQSLFAMLLASHKELVLEVQALKEKLID